MNAPEGLCDVWEIEPGTGGLGLKRLLAEAVPEDEAHRVYDEHVAGHGWDTANIVPHGSLKKTAPAQPSDAPIFQVWGEVQKSPKRKG